MQTRTRVFGSEEAAIRFEQSKIASKRLKGYERNPRKQ